MVLLLRHVQDSNPRPLQYDEPAHSNTTPPCFENNSSVGMHNECFIGGGLVIWWSCTKNLLQLHSKIFTRLIALEFYQQYCMRLRGTTPPPPNLGIAFLPMKNKLRQTLNFHMTIWMDGRSKSKTRSATRSHPFQASLPTSRTLSHKSSFIPTTCNLWNVLPSSCFPESYNLPIFQI